MHHALRACVAVATLVIATQSPAATIRNDIEAGGLGDIRNNDAVDIGFVGQAYHLTNTSTSKAVFNLICAALKRPEKAFFYVQRKGDGLFLLDLKIKSLMESRDLTIHLDLVHMVVSQIPLVTSMAQGQTRLEAARPAYIPLISSSNGY
jgi:hypothetical protein